MKPETKDKYGLTVLRRVRRRWSGDDPATGRRRVRPTRLRKQRRWMAHGGAWSSEQRRDHRGWIALLEATRTQVLDGKNTATDCGGQRTAEDQSFDRDKQSRIDPLWYQLKIKEKKILKWIWECVFSPLRFQYL